MKNRSLFLVVSVFFTASVSWADMMIMSQSPGAAVTANVLKDKNLSSAEGQKLATDLPKIVVSKKELQVSHARVAFDSIRDNLRNSKKEPHYSSFNEFLDSSIKTDTRPALISSLSPGYSFRRGPLELTKVPNANNRNREAITFVFLMNSSKKQPIVQENKRTEVHLMWTGSKRMFTEQKVIKNEYPVDVTMAQYDDGYAEGEWNVVMPSKKPRQVKVMLMWAF